MGQHSLRVAWWLYAWFVPGGCHQSVEARTRCLHCLPSAAANPMRCGAGVRERVWARRQRESDLERYRWQMLPLWLSVGGVSHRKGTCGEVWPRTAEVFGDGLSLSMGNDRSDTVLPRRPGLASPAGVDGCRCGQMYRQAPRQKSL
ncbi:hypothetical protein NDU88_004368 [Pleurodeles waltl]|uniref:Secreted protein n=1 Tax=Pleurodeles waltl TaxID=8319 RepID=A0AAV7NN83_PLEWA|nr:hypothetical protein NDU88_004368 [Pleurodeles waltl]